MLADDIKNGETVELEFKGELPSDHLKFLKTAVAFANCSGGRIVFGVGDNRTIVGVDSMEAFRLADRIVDSISNSCEPQIAVSSEVTTVDGKTVVVVSVPMGMATPYHVKSLGKTNGTFVRVGATTRIADEDTVMELAFAGAGKTFDSQICRGMMVTDREIERLCSVMYRMAKTNCKNEEELRAVRKVSQAQLEDWGVLARRGGKVFPTYSFALLAGSRKFWTEVQCAVFRGETKADFIDRREFSGSVLKQIDVAFDYVLSKINMGMEIRGIYRHDIYEIPPAAIRELIVNAVVHRQYINPHAASIQVALYDTHLDIVSPGGLPHGLTIKLMNEGHSRARNKSLALACRYMRIIEEWGSGVPRIQKTLAAAGLRPLEIIDNGIDLLFRVWRPEEPIRKVGQKNRPEKSVRKIGQKSRSEKSVKEIDERIVDLMRTTPEITQNEMIGKLGVARSTIILHIAALKESGRIRRIGPDKGGRWEVLI